jgi:hypothetical protein
MTQVIPTPYPATCEVFSLIWKYGVPIGLLRPILSHVRGVALSIPLLLYPPLNRMTIAACLG